MLRNTLSALRLLAAGVLIPWLTAASAQALSPGAIAFTGFNSDDNDNIAFVALVNLPAGQIIRFTDDEWNGQPIGSGGAFTDTGESEFFWTAPAGGVNAGTIVRIDNLGTGTIAASTGSVAFTNSGNRGLSNDNDMLYAYEGTSRNPSSFLAAIGNHSSSAHYVVAGTGLTTGSTSILLPDSQDAGAYTGSRSSQTSFAAYLPLIGNTGNWNLQSNGNNVIPFSTTSFTVPAGGADVSINSVSLTEGNSANATLSFTVTRSNNAGAFSVSYTTANQTATAGSDYVATSGTLNFTAGGALTQTVNVTVNGDTTVENDETFVVNLSNIVNTTGTATLTVSQGVGTIVTDDQAAPQITTQPLSQSIASGDSHTLSVVASGYPAPACQWYQGISPSTANPISGATAASFTTPALFAATSYWVRVTNSQGSVDSQTATVSITATPVFSNSNRDILAPNTGAWDANGVTLNGTQFVNLGLQGVGRIAATAIDPATGESIGSISDMHVHNFVNNGNGTWSGTFSFLPDRGYNTDNVYSNYAARINAYSFTFTPYTGTSSTTAQNQIAMTFQGSTRFTYDHDGNAGTAPVYTTGLNSDNKVTLFGTTAPAPTANTTQSDGTVAKRLTVDAEGLVFDRRAGKAGTGWIGDEYGAYIYHFNANRVIDGIVPLPAALIPHTPNGTVNFDGTPDNGRRDNQGMEGLAQSPDGTRLFGMMQSATVQDSASGNVGRSNTRLLVYDVSGSDLPSAPIAQYVIQLPRIDTTGSTSNGNTVDRTAAQSSILALNNHQLLILSRDGNGRGASGAPIFKSILLADLNGATNIGTAYNAENAQVAPGGTLSASITPLTWTEALNMIGKLNASTIELAKFNLNINSAPGNSNSLCEKWEALSLVHAKDPANPDDYFLFVGNDNDFLSGSGKYLNAAGNITSYDAGLENDTIVLAYRIRMTGAGAAQPTFVLPASPIVSDEAVVTFSVSANDSEGNALTPVANPPSGSTFPVGDTTVEVTATDSHGTTATRTFVVHVNAPPAPPTSGSGGFGGNIALSGSLNPNGVATTVYYQWGTTTGYGQTTSSVNLGNGNSSVPFSFPLGTLPLGTTYHYRLVVVTANGTVTYPDQVFATGLDVPAVPSWIYPILGVVLLGIVRRRLGLRAAKL